MDDVDLLEGGADGFLAHHGGRNVDRPELRAHAALTQAGHVGHQLRHRLADVGLAEIAAGIEPAQRPRVIVVPVDERCLLVERDGARLEILRQEKTA